MTAATPSPATSGGTSRIRRCSTDGSNAISDFVSATDGSVNFGGTVGPVPSYGVSYAAWNDPADADGWAAYATVLLPSTLPLGTVAAGLVNDAFS